METGRKTIGTAAAALTTTESSRGATGVEIYADSANSGVIYIGFRSNITSDSSDTTDGFPLLAGKSVLIPIGNPNTIYVKGSAASQKLWWMTV